MSRCSFAVSVLLRRARDARIVDVSWRVDGVARGPSRDSYSTQDDKLKFAFMIFDEDGNGVITKGELTRILRANHMASCDAEVARKADTIMQQADKDGDGVVTFDEFVIVSKKFPNILFPAYSSSK